MNHHRPFLVLWVVAVSAAVAAFVLHLALRNRTMQLGYELGKARAEQARMREVRRVLELEVASYQTPQRVEVVARTLLGMTPPSPDRIFVMPAVGGVSGGVAAPAMSGVGGAVPVPTVAAAGRPGMPSRAGEGPAITLPPTASSGELILPTITPPKIATTPSPASSASPSEGEP
ncbi:MAG: cell division protein FtsL [Polyangiaceae bacterium]